MKKGSVAVLFLRAFFWPTIIILVAGCLQVMSHFALLKVVLTMLVCVELCNTYYVMDDEQQQGEDKCDG